MFLSTFQRHRCVSLLPLPESARCRLDDFFTVRQLADGDELPPDTAALIVGAPMLEHMAIRHLPTMVRTVTVVGCGGVPQAFLDGLGHREVLVTWPGVDSTDADGWFDTGDLARMDSQGYIRIAGRSKDIIIRGGENIPVVEVENLLFRHPAVAEVVVVGYPDERLGERACAFVRLRDGAQYVGDAPDFVVADVLQPQLEAGDVAAFKRVFQYPGEVRRRQPRGRNQIESAVAQDNPHASTGSA